MSCTLGANQTFKFTTNIQLKCLWWLYQSVFSQAARFFWIISICFYQGFHSDTFTQVTRYCATRLIHSYWSHGRRLDPYWPSLDPSSSLCIHQRFSPGFEFLVTLGPGWPGHQCTMGEAVRAWQCRDERIRSEAGPVIVRPGAENLHESPLAPNMMDRWSHMNNLCSLIS